MPLGFSIEIHRQAIQAARRTAKAIEGDGWARVAGRAIFNLLRLHFRQLEQQRPNKQGWPRQHFWSSVRSSIQKPIVQGNDTLKVTIAHAGVALRYFGGKVRPVVAKALALPAVPEAYGKSPRDFPNLGFAILDGKPALVEQKATLIKIRKRKAGLAITPVGQVGGKVFFWLTGGTTHQPDPTVLPTDDDMVGSAALAGERWFDRILERGQATA